MKQLQPNFEKIKTLFYQQFIDSKKVDFMIAFESLSGKLLPSFNKRKSVFQKELNEWLDRLDIRQAGTIIDVLLKEGAKIPKWMREKQYTVNYNKNQVLDIIPNEKECEC